MTTKTEKMIFSNELIELKLKEALVNRDKAFMQMKEIGLFVSGVLLGIFTNILATGFWEWEKRDSWSILQWLMLSLSVLALVVILFLLLDKLKAIEKWYQGEDNVVRAIYGADELWTSDGKLKKITEL